MASNYKSDCFYGEYKCPHCFRTWESTHALENYGQKCKTCTQIVQATNLCQLYNYCCEPCLKKTKGMRGSWKYKFCAEGSPCRNCRWICQPFEGKQFKIGDYVLPKVGKGPCHIDPSKRHQRELCEKCVKTRIYCRNVSGEPQSKSRGGMEMWQLRVPKLKEQVPSESLEVAPKREEVFQAISKVPKAEYFSPTKSTVLASYDEDFPTISSSQSSSSSSQTSGIRTRFPKPKRSRKMSKKARPEMECSSKIIPAFSSAVTENRVGNAENRVGNVENRVGNPENRIGNAKNHVGNAENRVHNELTLSFTHEDLESPPSELVRPSTPLPSLPRQSFMETKTKFQASTTSKLETDAAKSDKITDAKIIQVIPAISTSNQNNYYSQPRPYRRYEEPDSIGNFLLLTLLFAGLSFGLSAIFKGRGK